MLAKDSLSARADSETRILGRLGTMETRLVRSEKELELVQELRFRVFFDEMGAEAQNDSALLQRDHDRFDAHCDHLLVLDEDEIVGTYRLLPQSRIKKSSGFYSQSQFDLTTLLETNAGLNFLELGRSCIAASHRNKRTMELLWHGTWSYALDHEIDVMFGCASFAGTNPERFSKALGWLSANAALNRGENCPAVHAGGIPLSQFRQQGQDARHALSLMPPMLKGYLRLGARVGSDAVIDHSFGTTDVLVVLKVADINPRYIAHYGADASRFAA